MRIRDIWKRVIVESGQFLIDPDLIELDVDKFRYLIKSVLGVYNKYVPLDDHFNIEVSSGYYHEFDDSFTVNGTQYGIPSFIIGATPIRLLGVLPYHLRESLGRNYTSDIVKENFPIRFENKRLYVPVGGVYEVHAAWYRKLIESTNSSGETEWEVNILEDDDDLFFDLARAKFQQILGRQRRAFTLEGMPLALDASEMISDGESLEEKTMENLDNEDHKFYLGWGG